VSQPWNKRSVGRVRRAKRVCLVIRSYVKLGWKIERLHILVVILVTLDMTEGIRPANQLQGRLDFVANIPVSLQSSIWECVAVFGIASPYLASCRMAVRRPWLSAM
jgi:hypothetical protein